MNLTTDIRGRCRVLGIEGRLDAFGSREFEARLAAETEEGLGGLVLVLDMSAVEYMSSAAIRVLVPLQQRTEREGGVLLLAGLQPYCLGVLEITGLADSFTVLQSVNEAVATAYPPDPHSAFESTAGLETIQLPSGTVHLRKASETPGVVEVLGHIEDVLYARVTADDIRSRRFSHAEYSIGLGGLGDRVEDYLHMMGEMITIGGTMVWLPTDGNDTPDFLIPRTDSGAVTLRTAFNVSMSRDFNEVLYFVSREEDGTSMDRLYRDLFDLAKVRRTDFRGGLGLAIRAEMATLFGSGVVKSPVADLAPGDGRMITDPAHFAGWFEVDAEPRHREVTALITGIGVDLTGDLSAYDPEELGAVFYLNPANTVSQIVMLHNHAVVFSPVPMPEQTLDVEGEIRSVVDQGDFIDMRHLLDRSSVRRAVIGMTCIQRFQRLG